MHIFLTGEIQVGKSTLIRRILEALPGLKLGGFLTLKYRAPEAADTELPAVYMHPPVGPVVHGAENRVGICGRPVDGPNAFPAVFDTLGVRLLAAEEGVQLILMDEIGKMERDATQFSNRILQLLDGDRPILGVVRKEGSTPLLEAVRHHPNVRLVEVTEENRDLLFPELLRKVRWETNRFVDSAGAIVLQESRVLMVSQKRGSWGFPKGHIEAGETARQAAIREVFEETGLRIALDAAFVHEGVSALPGERRKVTFFLGVSEESLHTALAPQPGETAKAAWIPIDRVASLLRFPEDIVPLQKAIDYLQKR